jgi:hypothetical protein
MAGVRDVDPVATARSWASYGPPVEPNEAVHRRYDELHAIFREAYQPLIGVSHRLGDWYDGTVDARVVPRLVRKRD